MINWFAETWWDDNLITPYLIKNRFKVTENELFTGFKRLEELIVAEDDKYQKSDMIEYFIKI